ncbi:MAG: recombinase family protein [Planctomycetaceae bacterium]|nr:recombinase family protein [Planctomycetales bacterium]MCB9921843.1 recombinase family protein [Planctomycetaceae bacterium]
MTRIIAYYRVSTKKQGKSGLGLEGQKAAVADYVRQQAGNLISEYLEVETGKSKDRPELLKAIAHAKRSKAKLVVAKLDRLARNVAFTSALMESNVDFVACDNPHANKFTIHILAAVAEHEAEQISQRTKVALAAAKARGVKLGSARPGHWEGKEGTRQAGLKKARKAAAQAHSEAFNEGYADLFPIVKALHEAGSSLQAIADELNEQGHTTRTGKPWNRMQVSRVLQRAS